MVNINKIKWIRHITLFSIFFLVVWIWVYFQYTVKENNAICERIILDSSFWWRTKNQLNLEELQLLEMKKRTCFNWR